MYCHQCGKQLPEEAAYCPACGTKVFQMKSQEKSPELVNPLPLEPRREEFQKTPFSVGAVGEDFIKYVNWHVQSTTGFSTADELLRSKVSTSFYWVCFLAPTLVLALPGWIFSGNLAAGLALGLLGLVFGFFAAYVAGWNERRKISNRYCNTFFGPIDTDDLMGFLSQGLPMVSSMFHEWNYLTQTGYGLYGIASAALINAAQRATKEVTLGTELGNKKHFFAELYVGPDLLDRESGKMRYTPDVDHRITGIFSVKKYTLLVQIAPILQAAMEYYLRAIKQEHHMPTEE